MNDHVKNYFQLLEKISISPDKNYQDNYQKLLDRSGRIQNSSTPELRQELVLIREAMPFFKDKISYQDYLFHLEQQSFQTENRKTEEARKQAEIEKQARQQAEDRHRKEEQRRKDLERELKEERDRFKSAELENKKYNTQMQTPEVSESSFGDVAGNILGSLAKGWLKSKFTGMQQPASLTGRWQGNDGTIFKIYQQGNQLQIQVYNQLSERVAQGEGMLNENLANLSFQNADYSQGTATLEVIEGGQH